MDTTSTPAFSLGSSFSSRSVAGYIRGFLTGRTGDDFLRECYALQEAYYELPEEKLAQLPQAQREVVLQARRLLARLIAFAETPAV